MKRVIGTGTLAEPSRARSSEVRSDPYEDAALEQAFARRERWALDGVYARYHSLLYSVAFNVLRNADDAQDCLHDALIRVWTKRVTYDVARGTLRGFLVVCVRNQAISQQRMTARLAKLSTRVGTQSIGPQELRIDDYLENRRLYAAFMSLPEAQRAPLVLSYFLGKTHVEIARELGLSLGTTKSRISLGLRRLGKTLKARIPS
jgi:RNA polymerase sigma-70 factor (ECF subfamily)